MFVKRLNKIFKSLKFKNLNEILKRNFKNQIQEFSKKTH